MPWDDNSALPKGVKNLPEEAQTTFRHIANEAFQQYPNDDSAAIATAWSGLKRAGWSKDVEGKWHKSVEKDSPTQSSVHINRPLGEIEKEYTFDIKKTDEMKQLAFGWCMISKDKFGQDVFDLQNDGITPDELEKLAYRYVEFYRDSGELHINSGKGKVIESFVSTLDKQQALGIPLNTVPIGWWIGIHFTDKKVWGKIKDGTYRAFSIQGQSIREEVV